MYEKELMELEVISKSVGNSPDFIQGGGGNTSVKLDETLMAVKASGYKLNQINTKEGYVVVNYKSIRNYYNTIDTESNVDFEKQSVEFAMESIVELDQLKKLRPSVEAGFHSLLKKYVIHTHSVYANILCCSKEGKEIAENIFRDRNFGYIWIPYINPGFSLTVKIKEEIEKCIQQGRKYPHVIFMQNHGLIVNSDDYNECIDLHMEVNKLILDYLNIKEKYPVIKLDRVDEATCISNTEYIIHWFKGKDVDRNFFDRVALYPDQLVYLNGSISTIGEDNKLNINPKTGEIIYKACCSEALIIEETLLAYLYVINKIYECNLTLQTMTPEQVGFIDGWESEKYRKNMMEKVSK